MAGKLTTMNQADRLKKIRQIDDHLVKIHAALSVHHRHMAEICASFDMERKELLREARVQTKRSQISNLSLRIRARADRKLSTPTAEWRQTDVRGAKVARALNTMAAKRTGVAGKSRMGTFTNAMKKKRRDGWSMRDLMQKAHPCELDLVQRTELKLRPIRQEVTKLSTTGTRLLQSRAMHVRQLGSSRSVSTSRREKKVPSWALVENQLELSLPEAIQPEGTPERPQFRNPV